MKQYECTEINCVWDDLWYGTSVCLDYKRFKIDGTTKFVFNGRK